MLETRHGLKSSLTSACSLLMLEGADVCPVCNAIASQVIGGYSAAQFQRRPDFRQPPLLRVCTYGPYIGISHSCWARLTACFA
jgi:hypothetical protein